MTGKVPEFVPYSAGIPGYGLQKRRNDSLTGQSCSRNVWAFGCILFECLTGRRAFEGESVTEVLRAVLQSEPDWDSDFYRRRL